jgi:hypothetical protein
MLWRREANGWHEKIKILLSWQWHFEHDGFLANDCRREIYEQFIVTRTFLFPSMTDVSLPHTIGLF